MKVKTDNQTYFMDWQYLDLDNNPNYRGGEGTPTTITTCVIKNEAQEVVAEGKVTRKYGEISVKDIARRESMKKALRVIAPTRNEKSIKDVFFKTYNTRNDVKKVTLTENQF